MPETDLDARLDAVERALTDRETDLAELRDAAALADRVDELETRVAELESTVEDLDAAVQAIRGYAGNVRAVNRDVERRASAALAKAEAIETALDEGAGAATVPEGETARAPSDDAAHGARDETAPARNGRTSGQRGEGPTGSPRTAGGAGAEANSENRSGVASDSAAVSGPARGAEGPGDRVDESSPPPQREGRSTGSDVRRPNASEADRSASNGRRGLSPDTERRPEIDTGCEAGPRGDRSEQSGDGTSARTEQFIERVRDAL